MHQLAGHCESCVTGWPGSCCMQTPGLLSCSYLPVLQQAADRLGLRTLRPVPKETGVAMRIQSSLHITCIALSCTLILNKEDCTMRLRDAGWQDSCCMRRPGRREARPRGPLRQPQEASGKPEPLHSRFSPSIRVEGSGLRVNMKPGRLCFSILHESEARQACEGHDSGASDAAAQCRMSWLEPCRWYDLYSLVTTLLPAGRWPWFRV